MFLLLEKFQESMIIQGINNIINNTEKTKNIPPYSSIELLEEIMQVMFQDMVHIIFHILKTAVPCEKE